MSSTTKINQNIDTKNESIPTYNIIGSGLIANSFKEHKFIEFPYLVTVFSSGVSNSLETRRSEFLREKKLLNKVLDNKASTDRFIYFSTLSVYDKTKQDSAYVNHKLEMEKIITQNFSNHLILRVPNIIGKGGNPTTLLNYLITSIHNNSQIQIFMNAYRNFIDVADLTKVVTKLIESNKINTTIDLLHPVSYSMVEIMEYIENHISKKANSIYLEKGYNYFPQSTESNTTLFKKSNICLDKNYLNKILKKYY